MVAQALDGMGRSAGGDRHRRSAVRERRADRREGLRGVHRRRVARVRVTASRTTNGRRSALATPRGTTGNPKGVRCAITAGAYLKRGRADARVRHRARARAYLWDAADVPLQRLGRTPGGVDRGRRDPRVPAVRRSGADLLPHRGARGDPTCCGRAGRGSTCSCMPPTRSSGSSPTSSRWPPAAPRRRARSIEGMSEMGFQRPHPSLRSSPRPTGRPPCARGRRAWGRARHGRARGPDGPPGRSPTTPCTR